VLGQRRRRLSRDGSASRLAPPTLQQL